MADSSATNWAALSKAVNGPNGAAVQKYLEAENADLQRPLAQTINPMGTPSFGDRVQVPAEVARSSSPTHAASEARQRANNHSLEPAVPGFPPLTGGGSNPGPSPVVAKKGPANSQAVHQGPASEGGK